MKPPLAILGRHAGAVLFQEGSYSGLPVAGFEGDPRVFSTLHDADAYLCHWLHDGGAMSRLRQVLHDLGHSRTVARCTDREVVAALASRLAAGTLVVREREVEKEFLNVSAAFNAAAARARPAAPTGDVIRPPAPAVPTPPAVPEVPLLPLLEKVQIEGAEVLPEILQTLAQVKASLGSLDLASVSLEPTPSGVPGITAAMNEAAASVTSALGDL